MNKTFHYFTVKTLCYYAGLHDGRAQDIAFYSQFVDDFNCVYGVPWSAFLVAGRPPEFFVKNNLALQHKNSNNIWWIYPATTAISFLQSAASMLTQSHQYLTLIPFHFIPARPIKEIEMNDNNGWRCVVADGANDRNPILMEQLMNEFFQRSNNDENPPPTRESDMELGMLLHTYADTFAHQMFSGRLGSENNIAINKISNQYAKPIQQLSLDIVTINGPGLGHTQAGHVPDAFALQFSGNFNVPHSKGSAYSRNNMSTFLDCAYKIYEMLQRYNHQILTDDIFFKNEIAPKLLSVTAQCVDGVSEIEEMGRLRALWKQEFPDIEYDYAYSNMWGLTKVNDTSSPQWFYDIYKASNDFYKYNELAYKHIYRVTGKYRGI